ncbi:MAG TPA: LuxR C-terminal-related transcriptional regulator [Devosia sp.]|nr:LuxR C-terminal-related transcriptional regulator [Devosia sp.]
MDKNYVDTISNVSVETTRTAHEGLLRLSQREREILKFMLNGHTSKQIARDIGISHRTVDVHRQHILLKTGTRTLIDLMRAISAIERAGLAVR